MKRVVLCGVQTPNCIRATAVDALGLDYGVQVLSDATASKSEAVQVRVGEREEQEEGGGAGRRGRRGWWGGRGRWEGEAGAMEAQGLLRWIESMHGMEAAAAAPSGVATVLASNTWCSVLRRATPRTSLVLLIYTGYFSQDRASPGGWVGPNGQDRPPGRSWHARRGRRPSPYVVLAGARPVRAWRPGAPGRIGGARGPILAP